MRDNYNNPFDNFKERLASPATARPANNFKLSDLWEAFKNNKVTKKSWNTGSAQKNADAFLVILDIIGDLKLTAFEDDKPCLRFLEHIQLYPSNKNKTFPGKKYSPDMVKNAKFKPLSISHKNYHLQLLSSILKYGMKGNKWGLSVNHAEGLSLDDTRVVSEIREIFTKTDIENMFHGLSKTHMVNHPERLWLPVLALFTGARSNELCQLRIEDIAEVEGVPVIHIRHRPELHQTTKNEQDRVVPVHPDLIKLGFLEYVEQVKRIKKNERLWPALELYREKWNVSYGKHFNGTFCPKYVDKDTEKHHSFHCTRHTMIDWYKQNGLEVDGFKELLRLKSIIGHLENADLSALGLDTDITLGRYGKEFSVQSQLEFISKLDYRVDFGLLKKSM
jgi:integrase